MSASAARELVRFGWDPGDPWASCMSQRFAIARVLSASGEGVPDVWQYRPAPGGDSWPDVDEFPDWEWASSWECGDVCADDLRHFGEVLRRYARLCELAGRSY